MCICPYILSQYSLHWQYVCLAHWIPFPGSLLLSMIRVLSLSLGYDAV
jgi:hypothetical protein